MRRNIPAAFPEPVILPGEDAMNMDALVAFLKEIETFKTCERTCRTTRPGRPESDAEHSWHLAVFLVLLEDELKDIDFSKLLKIALIHDLPEIYAGDTNPYRGDATNKEANERVAANKLFSTLPGPIDRRMAGLFEEYMAQESPEARIVKAADKLMPLIQNLCTNRRYSSYRKLGIEYEEVREYMGRYFSGGILEKFYDRLLAEARDNGVFSDEGFSNGGSS